MESTLFSPGRYALFPGRYAVSSWEVRRLFMGGTPFFGERGHGVRITLGPSSSARFSQRTHPGRASFMGGTPFSATSGGFRASWKLVVRHWFHRGYAIRWDTRRLCLAAFMRGSPSPDAPRIDSWAGSQPGLTNSTPSRTCGRGRTFSKVSLSSRCARIWLPRRTRMMIGSARVALLGSRVL
jgi:hypothetical protein